MMAGACTQPRILRLLITLAVAFLLADPAHGSHFRYGHITWEPRPDISPTTVDFRFVGAFRRSSPAYSGSAPDGQPTVGDVILERQASGGTRMSFGDGSGTGILEFKIIASNPEEDWILGVARERNSGHEDFIRKTYPAKNNNGEPWRAGVTRATCCRLGGLRTGGTRYSVLTRVDLADGNHSPVSNLPPIVTCSRGSICSFGVPAVDPDGDELRWRLPTASESRITRFPGGRASETPLEIDPELGVVTWPTRESTLLGFYAAQFTIEDLDAEGHPKSSVAVDFLINLQDTAENNPPAFDVPPTPESGETLEIPVDATLEFSVQASDPDPDDTVTLNHAGLPAGASFETAPGNPGVGTFSWTPGEHQIGEHLVTFTAIDNHGFAGPQHPLRIEVVDPAIRDVSVTAEINSDRIVIDPDSFATEPDTIEQIDDATRVVWNWPTLTPEAREELDLAVSFQEPEADERRVLTWLVILEYTDIDGNRVERTLDTQYVEVLPSIFDVGAETDRGRYGPDDTVAIQATLENLSRFTADGELALAVVDSAGAMVADLGRKPAPGLEAGATRTFDDPTFHTAGTFAGDYRVRAQALDEAGRPVAEAAAPFTIGTGQDEGESVLAGRVTTDRSTYDPGGIVTVTDLISNVVANAPAEDIGVRTRVRDPDGGVIWDAEDRIPSLGPGGDRELVYSVPLGRAAPGGYRVELAVDDAGGDRAAEDVAHFQVRSTAESGVGLAGEVEAAPEPVLRTERLDLLGQMLNEGNASLEDLPAELLVVDGESGESLASWTFAAEDLPLDAERVVTAEWEAVVSEAGDQYGAVLRTAVGGEFRILAHTWFSVAEKLAWKITAAERGRVLVLLDGPERIPPDDACEGADELELAVAEPLALRPGDSVRAVLYDEAGAVISERESEVGAFESRWTEQGEAGAPLALTRVDRGRLQVALMGLADRAASEQWRLVLEVGGDGGPRQWSTDYFPLSCDAVAADGYGDFRRIAAWGPDAADPHGPPNAPTLAQQRRYLETLLRAHGWSYRIITDAADLAATVESEAFNAYALLHQHKKLPESLQRRLAEAAMDGAGLLVAGRHDQRNGRLEPTLGVKFGGRLPHADGVEAPARGVFAGGTGGLALSEAPLRVELTGAEPVARWTGSPPGKGNANPSDENPPAVAYHRPGAGATGHVAFDLLAEVTLAEAGFFDDLLIAGLNHVARDCAPSGYGPLGRVVTLENFGDGAPGRLAFPPVDGIAVADPGLGRITEDGGLIVPFYIEDESAVRLPFWLDTRDDAPASYDGVLRIRTESGALVDYGDVSIPLR